MHIYMHPAPRGLMEVYLHYHVTDKCPHVIRSGRDPQKFSGEQARRKNRTTLSHFLDLPLIYIYKTRTKNHFNKMKKEVGMLLQKRTDTSAVEIYKLYEENTH